MTLDEKATKTREMSVSTALVEIQNKLVAFKINGYHIDLPLDNVMKAIKSLDEAIDQFNEPITVEPGADVETSAPGLN
jgi:hypothetical protein